MASYVGRTCQSSLRRVPATGSHRRTYFCLTISSKAPRIASRAWSGLSSPWSNGQRGPPQQIHIPCLTEVMSIQNSYLPSLRCACAVGLSAHGSQLAQKSHPPRRSSWDPRELPPANCLPLVRHAPPGVRRRLVYYQIRLTLQTHRPHDQQVVLSLIGRGTGPSYPQSRTSRPHPR